MIEKIKNNLAILIIAILSILSSLIIVNDWFKSIFGDYLPIVIVVLFISLGVFKFVDRIQSSAEMKKLAVGLEKHDIDFQDSKKIIEETRTTVKK